VLRSSAAGALVLLLSITVIPLSNSGTVAGMAIVAKLVAELATLGRAPSPSGAGSRQSWHVVANQALNYVGANLDFVLVGVILGPAAFAIYALAFRVSSGINSIASFTIVRLATVRLAEVSGSERSAYLRRLSLPVFGVGLAGAVVTCLSAPLLRLVVGDQWTNIVLLVQILAFMLPFRLLHGLLGVAFLVEHADSMLFRIEIVRIVASLAFLSIAASAGLVALSATALALSIGAMVGTALQLDRATALSPIRTMRPVGRDTERVSS
jgi:O-antigen/teichoic acid export membrane protein